MLNGKHFVVMFVGLLSTTGLSHGQDASLAEKIQRQAEIRGQVKAVFDENRKISEFRTPQGVSGYTFMPPSQEGLSQIRVLGKDAVEALIPYLKSPSRREEVLALRLLGEIGGQDIIAPLADYLRNSTSPISRQMALRWLSAVCPPDSTSSIFEEYAANDPDADVRAVAQKMKEAAKLKRSQAVDSR